MNTIIAPELTEVNLSTVIVLRAYDKKGEWHIEIVFDGGVTATTKATADEVNELESKLTDWGWQIEPSLFHRGYSAKPVEIEEAIFSSGRVWVDDYAIESYV